MGGSSYELGLATTTVASAVAVASAAYLLFTDVTTVDGTAATALEAGNVVLLSLAVLPVLVSLLCLGSAYTGTELPLWIGSGVVLVVGMVGVAVGPQLLVVGVLLLLSAFFVSRSGDDTADPSRSV
ncbi:hypothetical protein [Halorubellus litoreus]